jgi:hypothetical protein
MKTYEPNAQTAATLEKAFMSTPTMQDQAPRFEAITEKLLQLGRYLCSLTPASSEQTLMIRNLQEAGFWAKEAIIKNEK